MHKLPGLHVRHLSFWASALLFCVLCSAACSGGSGGNSGAAPAGAPPGASASSTPQVRLGTQACPEAVQNPAYWGAIIGTQSGISRVTRVACANLIGQPALQALILVSYAGSGQLADVYVYNDIIAPSPVQLFKLQGLLKGDASISGYNTLLTSEVDQASSLNKGRAAAGMTPDLFREFKWSDGAGMFVPVTFPGIFPDLTRFQAEAAQRQVNSGHQAWRLSALQTSQALAANLLRWGSAPPATPISGGGLHDVNAVVKIQSRAPGGSSITVSLSRLEGNSNGGIWEATAVNAPGLTLSSPQSRDLLSSSTVVSGSGGSGKVVILDHLYTSIGQANISGAGKASFSTHVAYNSTFKSGPQEGVLAFYVYNPGSSAIAGAVMLKELLS